MSENFEPITTEFVPWAPWFRAIDKSKVALIAISGVYLLKGLHEPYNAADPTGDASFREFPSVVDSVDVAVGPTGFDPKAGMTDINVLFPLERLRNLVATGYVDSLAPFAYSFLGRVTDPTQLLANFAPSVAFRLKRMGADIVMVVAAGGEAEHQTAALVARAVELAGVPTVVIGTNRAVLERVKPPRSVLVKNSPDQPMGGPGNIGKHEYIIRQVLEKAWSFEEAGAILSI